MMLPSRWMSVNDATRYLGLPFSEVVALVTSGDIHGRRMGDCWELDARHVRAYANRPAPVRFQEPVMGSLPSDPVERAERLAEWADDRHDTDDETGDQQ